MEYYCSSSRRLDFAASHFTANATTDPSLAIASTRRLSNFNSSEIANDFATSSNTMFVTPPPELLPEECNPPLYPYSFSYQLSGVSHVSGSPPFSLRDYFMRGSSLEDSPLSSPSSEVGSLFQGSNQFMSSYSNEFEEPPIPNGIKMPQRKGGIQLWQFLYALLTDPDHMHPELIEWTYNRRENEFRLLEPEAIAVWWGYHKNKVNVNYEKFSRSLRYYYDKGILKKIPGERYVYRFCIDPEQMYKHIGISDCRPQVKPMPEDVKQALAKFKGRQNLDLSSGDLRLVTPGQQLFVAPVPISRSHSDSLPSHQQSPNCSCIGSYQFGAIPRVPIERSSSFDVVYPTYSANPSEELPHTNSSVSVPDSFKYFAASQELYDYSTAVTLLPA